MSTQASGKHQHNKAQFSLLFNLNRCMLAQVQRSIKNVSKKIFKTFYCCKLLMLILFSKHFRSWSHEQNVQAALGHLCLSPPFSIESRSIIESEGNFIKWNFQHQSEHTGLTFALVFSVIPSRSVRTLNVSLAQII